MHSGYLFKYLRNDLSIPGTSNMESILYNIGFFRGFDFHIPSSKYSSSHRSLGKPAKFPGNLFSADKWLPRSTPFCLNPGITFSFTINWCIYFLRHLFDREFTYIVCHRLIEFESNIATRHLDRNDEYNKR